MEIVLEENEIKFELEFDSVFTLAISVIELAGEEAFVNFVSSFELEFFILKFFLLRVEKVTKGIEVLKILFDFELFSILLIEFIVIKDGMEEITGLKSEEGLIEETLNFIVLTGISDKGLSFFNKILLGIVIVFVLVVSLEFKVFLEVKMLFFLIIFSKFSPVLFVNNLVLIFSFGLFFISKFI